MFKKFYRVLCYFTTHIFMEHIINKAIIVFACIILYLSGIFPNNTDYSQYYIVGYSFMLMLNVLFDFIFTRVIILLSTPVLFVLNFLYGDITYICVATMTISTNVWFYTLYKMYKDTKDTKANHEDIGNRTDTYDHLEDVTMVVL